MQHSRESLIIMKIITYDQLEDRSDIYLLWAKSFGFYCTSNWIDEWAPQDVRLKDTPIGFCAVERNKLLGFVGVMRLPTRNKYGETENVGGIWAVATRPALGRKGIGRRLLDTAEDYLREQGMRLSILTTSRSIVAYRWYSEIGYKEIDAVNRYPHFYKFPRNTKRKSRKGSGKINRSKVLKLLHQHLRNNCGFTYRDDALLRFVETRGSISPEYSFVGNDAYFLGSRSAGTLLISEILAPTQKAYRELLKKAESMAPDAVYSRFVFEDKASKSFARANYQMDPEEYHVAMWKSLDGTKFGDVFDKSFVMPRLDFF